MGFKCGIVGLPNVGKSSLFNALTEAGIASENYPFCTIEPNVGVVAVPDARLQTIADLVHPQKVIPAVMNFVDIAGLVSGASKGEGLGNKFLSHIRQTDAIIHLVRCFEDDQVIHVDGDVDALKDAQVINLELIFADLAVVENAISKQLKLSRTGNKEATAKLTALKVAQEALLKEQWLADLEWDEAQRLVLDAYQLITMKPLMYVANVGEESLDENVNYQKICSFAKETGVSVLPICVQLEEELSGMSVEEKTEFLLELGWQEPGLLRLIRNGYNLLGLATYFTAGKQEVRAWTIPKICSAPEAAGKIHSDFQKGFIRAEVMNYQDFVDYGSESKLREVGKLRVEGKDYMVQDGNIMHFLFNN